MILNQMQHFPNIYIRLILRH